jgi:carbon monoxide dehydrogenase subunit G
VRIEANVTIDRPLDEVWRFMTDFSNYPKIHDTFVEMKQTSTGPLGAGAVLEARHRKVVYYLRVGEFDPKDKFTLVHTSGRFKGTTDIFEMQTSGGKTLLTWTIDARLGGLYRLLAPFIAVTGPFLARGGRGELTSGLGKIKLLLESETKP